MDCPKCNSKNYVRDGIVKGKQRYYCKDCYYRYRVKSYGMGNDIKRRALELYLEGLGFRSIVRLLGLSNVTILRWVRSLGQKIEDLRLSEGNIKVIELDELHTYISSKKSIVGYGWLLVGLGKASSISLLAVEERKQGGSCGKK